MDYEKAYKDALERARNIRFGNPNSATANVVCEEIFPELCESKDERVKKAIIHILYENYTDAAVVKGFEIAEIVAWLEKQGEQKPAWSEEDEKMVEQISNIIKTNYAGFYWERMISWLKFIKERMKGE